MFNLFNKAPEVNVTRLADRINRVADSGRAPAYLAAKEADAVWNRATRGNTDAESMQAVNRLARTFGKA